MFFEKLTRPDFTQSPTQVKVSEEKERMAEKLVSNGYKFEMEQLPSGMIHMDCSKQGLEGPVALELCDEDFVNETVERLVEDAYGFVFRGEIEFWDEDEDPEEFWRVPDQHVSVCDACFEGQAALRIPQSDGTIQTRETRGRDGEGVFCICFKKR